MPTKSELIGSFIGVELLSGERIFGRVEKWSKISITVLRKGTQEPIEIPRNIIERSLVLLDGLGEE